MYRFYFDKTLIPVAPKKTTTKINNRNETLDLASDGEINILKAPGLTEFNLEVLLPGTSDFRQAMYEGGFKDPSYFLGIFEQLKLSKKPFLFSIVRMLDNGSISFPSFPILVSLEEYEIEEDAENGFDVIVPIKLLKSREEAPELVKTKQINGKTYVEKTKVRQSDKAVPKTIVSSGSPLWNMCKLIFGDGEKFRDIAKLNNIDDPNNVPKGQVLRLE